MYGFLGHLVVHTQKDKILSYPLFIFLSGLRRGVLQILISEAEEEDGLLNSKLEWIKGLPREKFHKISGPNLVHGFPGPFGLHSLRKKIMSYLFSILLSGPRRLGVEL